ncbi:MAG: ferrous iron transport protein A [Oscillospiraceae bacterium]|nr:ferrous iron transport protein A [Oscillospiraceae bacterium]
MMPLSMMNVGETKEVLRVKGKDETRQFLENLGFVEGSEVTVVSKISGNLIVHIKDSRIAIDQSMANRILV